jgi:hypothetical protein
MTVRPVLQACGGAIAEVPADEDAFGKRAMFEFVAASRWDSPAGEVRSAVSRGARPRSTRLPPGRTATSPQE